jgi:hypothetical protein
VRGVLGDWRDPWDEPDDHAQLHANAEAIERQHLARAKRLGAVWRQELAGTPNASGLVQRSAGREPSSPHDRRGADSIAFPLRKGMPSSRSHLGGGVL